MTLSKFTMKIRPFDSVDGDFQNRGVETEVSEEDVDFPEGVSARDKSLVLSFLAAQNAYIFAAMDNMIEQQDMVHRIKKLRANLAGILPENLWPLIGATKAK